MKLLLACFLIAVVIVFSKIMRRSVGKKTAPDSIQAITQPAVGRILVSDKSLPSQKPSDSRIRPTETGQRVQGVCGTHARGA